jgi:type II secretory ATPase GspE/PulE/Tfp pilus assembly ATPase PilB-like protein
LYGEKAVLRLFPVERRLSRLDELGLPEATVRTLQELVQETSGALLFVGPAGCGKTTTALACLREVVAGGALRSVVSLEDPIEVALDGVAQTQVDPATGLDLVHGLKFLLRQDPEVLLLGEIRDQATAEAVLQAALSGHLLLSTFHAPDALGALTRLLDMELPPYSVRSGVRGVVAQRLLRRLCSCAAWSDRPDDRLDLPVPRTRVAGRCDACRGSGYSGRVPVAELLRPDAPELVDRLRQRGSLVEALPSLRERGFLPLLDAALALVDSGVTSAAEVRRVFGFLRPGL